MYVITVEFRIRTDHKTQFMTRVREQSQDSLNREPGCLQLDVCSNPADAGRVFLYEVYSDEAAFQQHLESAYLADFNATTTAWVESKTIATWHRHD